MHLKLVEQDNHRECNADHQAGYHKGHKPDDEEGQFCYNDHTVNDFFKRSLYLNNGCKARRVFFGKQITFRKCR